MQAGRTAADGDQARSFCQDLLDHAAVGAVPFAVEACERNSQEAACASRLRDIAAVRGRMPTGGVRALGDAAAAGSRAQRHCRSVLQEWFNYP